MANNVFANGREISCKKADGKSICCFPDVCFTPPDKVPPTPPGVPIPYPNTGMAKDATSGSKKVKISAQEVMLKNKSFFKTSSGNEAGCAQKKGVVTSKTKGKVFFAAWSMDVKVEGENVVRHLDLTTHNHGSSGNTPPWPYMDAMAMAVAGHPCKGMAEDIKDKCSSADDYGKSCCDARKCFLMPKTPNACCNGSDDKQMTGHHLLPSKEFVAHADRQKLDSATNYKSDKAPCLCVEGHSHSKRTEHGQVGCNYTVERNNWLNNAANNGKVYTLSAGIEVAAKSAEGKVSVPSGSSGCDQKCLAKQLEDGHAKMDLKVGSNDPLPRAKQTPSAPMQLD